jgi:hypothetical protein
MRPDPEKSRIMEMLSKIPGPPAYPVLGNAWELINLPLHRKYIIPSIFFSLEHMVLSLYPFEAEVHLNLNRSIPARCGQRLKKIKFMKVRYNIVLIVSLTLNAEIFYFKHLVW